MTCFCGLHFIVGKNWTSANVSILLNHPPPPQYQKIVDFAKSSPPEKNSEYAPDMKHFQRTYFRPFLGLHVFVFS